MNILIVDGKASNRRSLQVVLETENYSVVEATNGVEALEVLEKIPVHAIISDILMPRMDGYRLCMEVRAREKFRHLPFIFYTGTYTSPGDEKMALDLGADRFLKKHAPANLLLRTLREAIEATPSRKPIVRIKHEEEELMERYSQRLVDKLSKKNEELEVQTAALQKSEEQLRLQSTALETAANAIIITDRRGFILWSNPSFTRMTGYAPDEAIGKTPRILKSGQHDDAFYKHLWATILAGKSWQGELTNKRKDGSLYQGEQTITPVASQDGQITHFVGIMNDVTDRKRAEGRLLEREAQLRLFVEHSPAAIAMFDREMRYMVASRRWSTDYRLGDRSLVGYSHYEVFPDIPESWKAAHRRCLAGAVEKGEADAFPRSDGSLDWVRWEVRPWRTDQNEIGGLIIFSEIITERKRAEEVLRSVSSQEAGKRRQRVMRDTVVLLTSAAAVFVLGDRFSWFEWIFGMLANEAEYPHLDEFVGTTVFLCLGLLIFSFRRMQDGRAETLSQKHIAEALRLLHGEMENQVQQRTLELAQANESLRAEISQRKRAEESAKIFRTLLDHSHDIIEVIDPETGRFLDVNEGSCRAHGYSREEMLKLSVLDIEANFIDHSQWAKVAAHIRRTGFLTISGHHRRKDGSTFPVEVNCQYVELDRPYLLAVVRDVTERKQAENALRVSEERFRQLAENITEVFWMTDPSKNQMLYVSPAYEKIWGRTCESLYRSPGAWAEAIHPEDRERVLQAAMTKQVTGEYSEIYRISRPDGTMRWVHDRAYPIRNEAGEVYRVVGTAGDITQQRSLETQLRQAQKMEAIGTLAGGIAHDFNNILAAINGFTELAKMESPNNPVALEYLDEVAKAGWRATGLVKQILTFSRQQEQERKRLQLKHVVSEAFKLLRATVPSTIQFNTSFSPKTPVVLADATQVHQIVMNLGTNAAHAMRNQPGCLDVKLEPFTVDADFAATHRDLRPGPYALLSVSDSGHGMDRATLERIFEPFFTTKAPGEGTGLGLSVVHGIMQAHEGCITVYSQPGQGTTFHLYFPALVDNETDAQVKETETPRGHGERILFLDDEPPLVKLGQKMLERLGYAVETRTSPSEVFELVRARPGDFALVITDLTMPGMTGTDLARQLLQIRPNLPVILTTGYSATLTAEKAQAMGIRELLLKPLSRQTLGEAVYRVLNSKEQT